MVNLFDILRHAQGGQALEQIARQVGATPEQMQRAVDAMLPAFTLGLQRMAESAEAMGDFARSMAAAGQAPPKATETPAAGSDTAAMMFGSPEAAQRIAQQVAAASGVGAEMVRQMMPAVAAALIGGLARSAQAAGPSGWFGQWAEAMGAAKPKAQGPFATWGAMMDGFFAQKAEPAPPPPPPPPPKAPDMAEAVQAGLKSLFETGRSVHEQHMQKLKAIFDDAAGKKPPG